jgi:hypothetical protein
VVFAAMIIAVEIWAFFSCRWDSHVDLPVKTESPKGFCCYYLVLWNSCLYTSNVFTIAGIHADSVTFTYKWGHLYL